MQGVANFALRRHGAGNSIHIGKFRLCKSAEKNCSEAWFVLFLSGIIAVSSVAAKTSAFRHIIVFAGWKQRRVRACETPKRGCARLICVMMMPAYGRGSTCKDGVGSRCGNRLAYRRFWRRALCGRNILVAREDGDRKRLHNYNFDAPSM